jgi:ankyrin repeat protein
VHLAVRDNDYNRAELLLLYGANTNTFLHGKTPLIGVIQHGSIDVLELLLSHRNIDIRIQNREGESALTYAVKYGAYAGKEGWSSPGLVTKSDTNTTELCLL